jgi:hypothetical protein
MEKHLAAVILGAALLIYHQITTWCPLFPWNDVEKYTRKEILLEAGINGTLMGTALFCLIYSNTGFFRWFPLIYLPLLLIGECVDWWIPYFSDSFARKRKMWNYESLFSRTVKWIPHKSGKRTPDAPPYRSAFLNFGYDNRRFR